jgi:hypothetical protein
MNHIPGTVTVFFLWSAKREEKLRSIFTELRMPHYFRTSTFPGQKMLIFKRTFPVVVKHVFSYFGELTKDVSIVPF